jgi:hypothetical protein
VAMDTEVRCAARKPGAEGGPRMARKGCAGHGWVLARLEREACPHGWWAGAGLPDPVGQSDQLSSGRLQGREPQRRSRHR